MSIRAIESSDMESISELYSSVFSSAPWNEPWNRENALVRLKHIFESNSFVGLLNETNKSVTGMVLGNTEPFLNGNTFHLREMCVSPDFQGQGIGQNLMHELHFKLKKTNVSGVYLTTRNDIKASKFYKSYGYNLEHQQGVYQIDFNS